MCSPAVTNQLIIWIHVRKPPFTSSNSNLHVCISLGLILNSRGSQAASSLFKTLDPFRIYLNKFNSTPIFLQTFTSRAQYWVDGLAVKAWRRFSFCSSKARQWILGWFHRWHGPFLRTAKSKWNSIPLQRYFPPRKDN